MISVVERLVVSFLAVSSGFAHKVPPTQSHAPIVNTCNGTVVGLHSEVWKQDFFLGIPYAQPATGNNRFNLPKPIAKKWTKPLVAQTYGDRCLGLRQYFAEPESEDCLNLNILRPSGPQYANKKLPVFVWIHGGAFISSGSSNPPYNMTFMVDQSVKIGKPIIAVSMNYRLTAWGMLSSTAMKNAGLANLGLKDQRLALHWVQENIAAFGGDPKKVTIGGDSAGGLSVGFHLLAYGGRDDKLFRGAVMNSGNALNTFKYGNLTDLDRMYNQLAQAVNCPQTSPSASLACLRQVPSAQLWDAIQAVDAANPPLTWQYQIDGSLISGPGSVALKQGKFVKVPALVGATTDEGCYTSGYGVNTTDELRYFIRAITVPTLSDTTVNALLDAYPDDPVVGSPGGTIERFPPPYGLQYKRASSLAGDYYFIAGTRLTAQSWAERGQTIFSWRFNVLPNGHPREQGSTHVTDQAFVFANFLGVGYDGVNRYDVEPPSRKANYIKTGQLMSRSIMSFVHDLDPNNHGMTGYPKWPKYDKKNPKNFVFDGNMTSYVEPDTFRKVGINIYINSAAEFLR